MSKCTKRPQKRAFSLKIKAYSSSVNTIFFQSFGKNAQLATTFILLFSPRKNFEQKNRCKNRQF